MNLLQINTVGNIGSTGRIAEQIGIEAIRKGWKSYIACARSAQSKSEIIRIGAKWHRYPNVLWTRIFDSDSPLAKISTLKLINNIKKFPRILSTSTIFTATISTHQPYWNFSENTAIALIDYLQLPAFYGIIRTFY